MDKGSQVQILSARQGKPHLDLHGVNGRRVTLATLLALKERRGVAIKAMVHRLQQLGRIDSDQASSLCKQISVRDR